MRFSLPNLKIKNPLADQSPEDRSIMLMCLGFAFFFWLLVKLSNEYTVARVTSIQYVLPLGKAFAIPPPQQVSLNLTSTGWNFFVAALMRRDYSLRYDIPDRTTFSLNAFQLKSDLEAEINNKDIQISNLNFAGFTSPLEQQEQLKIPIIITSRLGFAAEYDLAAPIQLKPDSVVVVGPASQLKNTLYWPTDSLVLESLSESYEGDLALQKPQEGLRLAFPSVKVKIEVERYTEKSVFVPITLINPTTDSIRIFPDKALVKCVLGLGHYNALSADDFKLIADLNQNVLRAGKNTVPLELTVQPDYLRNALISPRSVEFFLVQQTATSENQ